MPNHFKAVSKPGIEVADFCLGAQLPQIHSKINK